MPAVQRAGQRLDMAGAVTRADRKGNSWVINGQKVWTTSAHKAHWGLPAGARQLGCAQAQGAGLLHPRHEAARRAGPSAEADERPRLVQPGVLHRCHGRARDDGVRRGRWLDGGDHDPDARAPRRRWAARAWAQASNRKGRIYEEEKAEIASTMEPYKWYPQRAGRVDLVMERAKATGKIKDPVIRQEIAKLLIMSKAAEWTARRAPGPRRNRASRRARGLARQAGVEQRRPPGGPRAHLHHRGRRAAHGRGQPDGRRHRRDPGLRPRHLDRRRHRRDPAQHHLRARPARCPRSPASTPTSRSRTCHATSRLKS